MYSVIHLGTASCAFPRPLSSTQKKKKRQIAFYTPLAVLARPPLILLGYQGDLLTNGCMCRHTLNVCVQPVGGTLQQDQSQE